MSLIISIIALGLIIAFHELGHFAVAKLFGVGVIEYSIGMGPRILSKVRGNTRYSLKAMPFGGSCMMLDEDGTADRLLEKRDAARRDPGSMGDPAGKAGDPEGKEEDPEEYLEDLKAAFGAEMLEVTEDAFIIDGRRYDKSSRFSLKPAWQRFLVILAGPVFNLFLAFVFALIITAHYGYDRPLIKEVDAGMPIEAAGIEPGDVITGLKTGSPETMERSGGITRIETARDISLFMLVHQEEMQQQAPFRVQYLDHSEGDVPKTADVVPAYDAEGRCRLGFTYSTLYEPAEGLGQILHFAWYNVRYCMRSSLESIRMLVRGRVSGDDVMGPVGMVAVMDESVDTAASEGGFMAAAMTLINILILISGSLGVMNLLPIPALDGGRLLFILIEMILGHPVPREIESRIHAAGMLFLLGLMALILFHDVFSLIFK